MIPAGNNYFLGTIWHLRDQEEMLIYDRFTFITTKDEQSVGDFLQKEYERECMEFPGTAPAFEQGAAIWAARFVFVASQLLLSREKNDRDIVQLLPPYKGPMTPEAILSADLCLRCLPDVIGKAIEINPDDVLILLLEDELRKWHYSGVGYFAEPREALQAAGVRGAGEATGGVDWEPVLANDCLRSLYVNRVIERRVVALARTTELRSWILAALGDHGAYFWKEV